MTGRGIGGTIGRVLMGVAAVIMIGSTAALHHAWTMFATVQQPGLLPQLTFLISNFAFPAFTVALALASLLGAHLYIRHRVIRPLVRLTGVMDRLATGDRSADISDLDRIDEVGEMARTVAVFKENALALDRQAAQNLTLEQRVRTLLGAVEHSPVSIVITDSSGRIEYVNPRFCEQSGWRPEDVIGQRPSMFKSGHTPVETYRNLWDTIIRGREWKGEFYNRRKNGECYWEKTSIAPVLGSDGAIRHFVAVKEDITESKDAERRAWLRAHYDPLTELPNRSLFEDRLDQALARAKRTGGTLALMFVDLDRFKEVNDTLGHSAGDELLQEAALRLRGCIRETDTVSRLGGDEFVVVLSDLGSDGEAAIVATRINRALATGFDLDAGRAQIGVSIGIAVYPRDGQSADMLMKNADAAMYWGKESGRNTYRFYSADPGAHLESL